MANEKIAAAIENFKNGDKANKAPATLAEIDAQIADLQRRRASIEEAERKAALCPATPSGQPRCLPPCAVPCAR